MLHQNNFLKTSPTSSYNCLLIISIIVSEPVFKACFPKAFAPENNRGLRQRMSSLKKEPMLLTLHPLTRLIKRTYFAATTLISVVLCISSHCNLKTEIYCFEDYFLKFHVIMLGISLSSNCTSSPVFVSRRKVMNSMNDCSICLYRG